MKNVPGTNMSRVKMAKAVLKDRNWTLPDLGYNGGLYLYTPFKPVYKIQSYDCEKFAAAIDSLPDSGNNPTLFYDGLRKIEKELDGLKGHTIPASNGKGQDKMNDQTRNHRHSPATIMSTSMQKHILLLLVLLSFLLAGCGTVQIRNPVPLSVQEEPRVLGRTDLRFWGDDIPPQIELQVQTLSQEEIRTDYPSLFGQPHNYLAISGGGSDGAFGAGVLIGWTRAGNRPMFQMVTGISTGALIAPFAFLGPDYDPVLKSVYTTISTKDIMHMRPLMKILGSDAAADSTPLLGMIQGYVHDDVIAAIAAQHRTGRRLYIGTSDLDYMRPRIWDIGAIASSGKVGAKDLIHQIMLASASIPGVFPPVHVTVEAQGLYYDEMHVDGGVCSQVFVYPAAMDWRELLDKLKVPGPANIYVIRNSALKPRYQAVESKLGAIAGRSISSLIRTQGIGDLYLIYMLAQRDESNFRLARIPDDFDEISEEPFDTVYMNKLFERGYRMAQGGYPWEDTPPGWHKAVGR